MGSKAHMLISYVKSAIRMIGCGILLQSPSIESMKNFALAFIVAEILGLAEEWFDERGVSK